MSLEDGAGILVDGFERTFDGKLKCLYCSYATRGTARLVEHIRMHTGGGVTVELHWFRSGGKKKSYRTTRLTCASYQKKINQVTVTE